MLSSNMLLWVKTTTYYFLPLLHYDALYFLCSHKCGLAWEELLITMKEIKQCCNVKQIPWCKVYWYVYIGVEKDSIKSKSIFIQYLTFRKTSMKYGIIISIDWYKKVIKRDMMIIKMVFYFLIKVSFYSEP